MEPIWVHCDCCDDYLCTIHTGLHAWECACPDIETWAVLGIDPYTQGADEMRKQTGGEAGK